MHSGEKLTNINYHQRLPIGVSPLRCVDKSRTVREGFTDLPQEERAPRALAVFNDVEEVSWTCPGRTIRRRDKEDSGLSL
jgi:hypothetical protein